MPPRLRQPRLHPTVQYQSISSYQSQCVCQTRSRQFSTTPRNATRLRDDMFRWLNGPGNVFRQPLPGSTNYINAYDKSGNLLRLRDSRVEQDSENGAEKEAEKNEKDVDDGETSDLDVDVETATIKDKKAQRNSQGATVNGLPLPKETPGDLMPFPMNRLFRSQSVLSEELKDAIYERITVQGKSVRDVSAALGVEMRRVGAVVRLKAVEKKWESKGKPLATPYSKAILSMLPQTPYIPNDPQPHETINDLPVHRATTLQLFQPVPESRHFTRRDAAHAFEPGLLPAEERIPHTELYLMEKWKHEGVQREERIQRMRERNQKDLLAKRAREEWRKEKERTEITKVDHGRSVFKFQDVKVDVRAGKDGRGVAGVGARYGLPHQDRKRGVIKIPTRVD